jgi:hypothetical protein
MKAQKLVRYSAMVLGLACAFPALAQQSGASSSQPSAAAGSSASQQSAAGGQSAPAAEPRDEGTNWGWLGLLGLIGLAGLRRRHDHQDRPYTGTGTRGAT